MGKIDNPLDQIESQHRDDGPPVSLADILNVSSVLVALVSPHAAAVSAFAKITAFGMDFTAKRRKEARATAFQEGLCETVGDLATEIIEKRAVGVDAEDAVITAMQAADRTARLDKARRFGQIIGGALRQESPNWQEASEFIRDVEQFTDSDVETLKIFWKVQRAAYRAVTMPPAATVFQMTTDANDYTQSWKDVLERAEKARISKDDWGARCGRLLGFGLTNLVQPNGSFQGPDAMCYRLTGRGVRLMILLGMNIKPGAYPKVLYHPTKGNVTLNDEDQEDALGDGWFDTPAKFPKQ